MHITIYYNNNGEYTTESIDADTPRELIEKLKTSTPVACAMPFELQAVNTINSVVTMGNSGYFPPMTAISSCYPVDAHSNEARMEYGVYDFWNAAIHPLKSKPLDIWFENYKHEREEGFK